MYIGPALRRNRMDNETPIIGEVIRASDYFLFDILDLMCAPQKKEDISQAALVQFLTDATTKIP